MGREVTLFTFPSTYYALKAEKLLKEKGFQGWLIPMPKEISSLCGLALEIETVEEEKIWPVLSSAVKLEKKVKAVKTRGFLERILEVVELSTPPE
ncbi:MAG: DUF3343 domain-containing protein [Moorellaceae bacterium]